jgi:hypothetical protein
MAIEFTTSSKDSAVSGVKMTVYGGSGIGKTMLAATLPRPIIISAEKGNLSLSLPNITKTFGAGRADIAYDMPIAKINDANDLEKVQQWLLLNGDKYDSVVMDSMSEIAAVYMSSARATIKDGRQLYPDVVETVGNMFRWFRDLPGKHVLLIGQLALVKDPITGQERSNILMPTAKLSDAAPYFMDETFAYILHRHTDGKEYRVLKTKIDFQHYAKDRSGCLDPLEAPHLGNIIGKIQQYALA